MVEDFNYKKLNILQIALFSGFLLLVQYTCNQLFDPGYLSYTTIIFIGIIASISLIFHSIRKDREIFISILDIAFLTFTLLLFLRWIGSDNSWIYSKAAIAFSLIPIYFFVKQYRSTYLIHWAIVFSGVVQIIVSILQKSSYLINNNHSFEVGGTFGNPNVLAMVLLLTIPSAFFHFKRTHSSIEKNLLLWYILMALSVIVFTKCRTAILGSILIGIFIFLKRDGISINRTSRIVWLGGLGVSCLGFIFLIFEKSESMVGRFLIWQSCFIKIIEKPFWGFGISSFHEVYPEAQRLFFETNSNATYLKLADSPQWAYNDFIELWLESGIFTAISFVGILISLLYCWKTQKRYNINRNNLAFLSATIFFILSTVNFAYTAWPVLIIFIVNLAWSSRMCNNIIQFKFARMFRIGLVLALILLIGNIILGFEAGKNLQFQYEFKKIDIFPLAGQNEFFLHSNEKYCAYAPFTYSYAALLRRENDQQEAIQILHKFNKDVPSFQTNYQLAEIYLELADLNKAKFYYVESSKFLPNRISPHFQLFMIGLAEKDFKKADSIKSWILDNEFKGDPAFIKKTKETLSKYKIIDLPSN